MRRRPAAPLRAPLLVLALAAGALSIIGLDGASLPSAHALSAAHALPAGGALANLTSPDLAVAGPEVAELPGSALAEPADDRIDRAQLLRHLSTLAHDSMEGRRTGTPGNQRARRYLLRNFDQRLDPVDGIRSHEFTFTNRRDGAEYVGLNIMGMIRGTEHPERYIVVTAHYDHLGIQNGEIHNGADDNASGTSALLALADWFLQNRPAHSLIFVAMDAEEMGLEGARTWVEVPPIPLERIVMNVNLDMISRSEAGELYAAGTHHYPFLTPLVEEVAEGARVTLLRGHDSPDLPPGDDWTMASDHGPFHAKGVPFIYFGVEDHPGYHNPSDTFENVTPEFYGNAVETILDLLMIADREGQMILEERVAVPTEAR